MTTEKQSYRLTRGNHHGPDPERPGKLKRFGVGDVVELSEFGAKALADKIEPVNAPDPVAHKAAVKAAAVLGVVLTLGIATERYARGKLEATLSIGCPTRSFRQTTSVESGRPGR